METPRLREYVMNVVPTIMAVRTQDGTIKCNSKQEFEDVMNTIIKDLEIRVDNLREDQILTMIKEKSPYRKTVKKCLKEKHEPKKILLSIMCSYMEFILTHSKFINIINFRPEAEA